VWSARVSHRPLEATCAGGDPLDPNMATDAARPSVKADTTLLDTAQHPRTTVVAHGSAVLFDSDGSPRRREDDRGSLGRQAHRWRRHSQRDPLGQPAYEAFRRAVVFAFETLAGFLMGVGFLAAAFLMGVGFLAAAFLTGAARLASSLT
jgi:hypothetical protein